MLRALVLALACSSVMVVFSASPARSDVENDAQVWTAVLGTARLGDDDSRLRFWADFHMRRSGGGLVHISRPGIGYSILPWLSGWLGYAWVPVNPDDGDTVHEHRVWQQLVAKGDVGAISLQSRTRFEQRLSSAGDELGLRVREFVRASWSPSPDSVFGALAWDELFLGLNQPDWGAPRGFDQNRLFLGPWIKIRKELRLEMGYLFLYLNRGNSDTIGHVVATNLFWSL